ncbi:MAG: formate--tetrahydrofolate ligase [Candidatus Omnitrophica bacterium]|nr:formate--tetrahydrofolate ligase [Candidatus Omnitrophota bacterium]
MLKLQPIEKIAAKANIGKIYLTHFGPYIAKVDLGILDEIKKRKQGKYILVTAMTPTVLGEGKTTIAIGLSMALNSLKKKSFVCIRQPSVALLFGRKGPGTGSGYSQVFPYRDINLYFTGDSFAIETANNFIAAFIDNLVYRGNPLNIDAKRIYWHRTLEISDRFLRKIKAVNNKSLSYITGFDITAASEIMAVLSLCNDFNELKRRVKRIEIGNDLSGNGITLKDLKLDSLIADLLKDAIKPNLVQTAQGTPCFVHTSPFGNIAHGANSIIADKIALSLSDFVITEAGFGADCGAEKFFNIKCRQGHLKPDVAVLVCSMRALRVHGLENLKKQIENVRIFGIPVIVAINRFQGDSQSQLALIKQKAIEFGALKAEICQVHQLGSRGGLSLAEAVIEAAQQKRNNFRFLYPLAMPLEKKIETIAKLIYGAGRVKFSSMAREKLKRLKRLNNLPVCMVKTHLSLSHNPKLKGAPSKFTLSVRDLRIAAGAGFILVYCGNIQTMPGLPKKPRLKNVL